MLAKGDSTTTTGVTIYQGYYDDKNGSIVFRDFKIARKNITLGTSLVTDASFTYNAQYGGFVLNNSTAAGTDRTGKYVEIDGVYYTITRASQGNAWGTRYYYTIDNFVTTSNFTSNIYDSVTVSNLEGTWNDMYGQTCTNQSEITGSNQSATGRNAVTTSGSKYFDLGVTSDNIAVVVYYDVTDGRLKLMYSTSEVTGNPGTAVTFTENNSITLPDYVGQYVSMAIDGTNGIHIAAFDANDSDLKYIYLTAYNASSYTGMTVDAAGSVGNWTSIKIDSNPNHTYYNKPIIAYYNSTETGGRETIKLAVANNVAGSVTEGIDENTNYTSTGWEYMTIPSIDPAQGGNQKFQQVCLDFDSAGRPVVGYLGTNLEFGKALDE